MASQSDRDSVGSVETEDLSVSDTVVTSDVPPVVDDDLSEAKAVTPEDWKNVGNAHFASIKFFNFFSLFV
jgi:hypothetical protein